MDKIHIWRQLGTLSLDEILKPLTRMAPEGYMTPRYFEGSEVINQLNRVSDEIRRLDLCLQPGETVMCAPVPNGSVFDRGCSLVNIGARRLESDAEFEKRKAVQAGKTRVAIFATKAELKKQLRRARSEVEKIKAEITRMEAVDEEWLDA